MFWHHWTFKAFCNVILLLHGWHDHFCFIKLFTPGSLTCRGFSEIGLLYVYGEGNGNPLQCSCLENPRDGGAWWAAVSGVTQSWTRLKRLSSSSSSNDLYASLVAQRLKRLPAMRETWVQSLDREDPLEKEMATHSSILAWRIPWRRKWQATPVFLPGKSHGRRSLVGYRTRGRKKLNATEWLLFIFIQFWDMFTANCGQKEMSEIRRATHLWTVGGGDTSGTLPSPLPWVMVFELTMAFLTLVRSQDKKKANRSMIKGPGWGKVPAPLHRGKTLIQGIAMHLC